MLVACAGNEKKDAVELIQQVETSAVARTTVNRVVDLSTTLQGYLTQNVAPSITGRIEHIFTEVGTNVTQGQMLVQMDQNQLNTTKLTAANLAVELQRMETLRETGAVSQQALDQTKLSYDQTVESLAFLEKNTNVKAPFAGVISAKNYEDGELYSGQPILVLNQINVLKALIAVSESYFPYVKKGMRVDVKSELYPGEVFPATVEIVYPTVDAATHTFQLKLKINNPSLKLRPGMYVLTTMSLGEVQTLVVPYSSVLKMTGSNDRYVFVADGNVAKRVFVKMGQRYNEMIEVTDTELKDGDRIVTLGQAKLVDGARINVVKEN
mgnify:CR=1 FL=1